MSSTSRFPIPGDFTAAVMSWPAPSLRSGASAADRRAAGDRAGPNALRADRAGGSPRSAARTNAGSSTNDPSNGKPTPVATSVGSSRRDRPCRTTSPRRSHPPSSSRTTSRPAATPRTSSRTRSTASLARRSASQAAAPSVRGRSTTVISWLRMADSSTDFSCSACSSQPGVDSPRAMDSRSTPSTLGSCPVRSPRCPRAVASRGHRQPAVRSAPSSRSSPPERGSASISIVRCEARAATNASPDASVDAPTPPEPPTTQTRLPTPSPVPLISARASDNQPALAGRDTTAAPSRIDHCCAWAAEVCSPATR